jgi:hypothetical protein
MFWLKARFFHSNPFLAKSDVSEWARVEHDILTGWAHTQANYNKLKSLESEKTL